MFIKWIAMSNILGNNVNVKAKEMLMLMPCFPATTLHVLMH